MQEHFQVEVRTSAQRAMLTLHGELDLASSAALEDELHRVDGIALVVVDLRDLAFLDSTGLGVIVKAHQRLREEGCQLALIEGDGQVRRLLSLTGLTDQLTIVRDPDDLPAASA